jgi:hypothetical protein
MFAAPQSYLFCEWMDFAFGGGDMFVMSFRHSRKRVIVTIAVAVAVVTAIAVLACARNAPPQATSAGRKYSIAAGSNDERVAFFRQFGWNVKAEPLDEGDVAIPGKFNDVYLEYNNIQQEQGLDLKPYAGKTVHQWIYAITNYPQQEMMRGTLLVSGGKVIGGDLSTPALDGFMTGFDGQHEGSSGACEAPFKMARNSMNALTGVSLSGVTGKASSAEEASKPAPSNIPANAWPTD